MSIVLSFSPAEHFYSWFGFDYEVKDWGGALCKWFIYLEPQGNGGWYSYSLCSACAWMVGSTIPRPVDRKKRIIGIATKVTRPVAHGQLFLGLSKILDILRKRYMTWSTSSAGSMQPAWQWQVIYRRECGSRRWLVDVCASNQMVSMYNILHESTYIPHGFK